MKRSRPLASSAAALYTYAFGDRSLYVPLTSRCNSLTLVQTRGPEFLLPPDVVAALLRVRDVEHSTTNWKHWCMYLDTQEYKQKLPPPLERVEYLPHTEERFPSLECLKREIDEALNESSSEQHSPPPQQQLVIAGEGEPTLRWNDLLALASSYSHMNVRVITNGLLPLLIDSSSSSAQQLKQSGVDAVSVALMTADANQYSQLMQPLLEDSSLCPHTVVCDFIQQAVDSELDVEVTAVDRADVDKEATQILAIEMGIVKPVRWRPYFP